MKKTVKKVSVIIALILAAILLIWLASWAFTSVLSAFCAKEFADLEAVGCNYMHPWETDPKIRVLWITGSEAIVYYYGNMGGEKVAFEKVDGNWTYQRTCAMWSDWGGTADDYFIWPYFKNYIP